MGLDVAASIMGENRVVTWDHNGEPLDYALVVKLLCWFPKKPRIPELSAIMGQKIVWNIKTILDKSEQ